MNATCLIQRFIKINLIFATLLFQLSNQSNSLNITSARAADGSREAEINKCISDLGITLEEVYEKRAVLIKSSQETELAKIAANWALQKKLVKYYSEKANECSEDIHSSNLGGAYQFIKVGTFSGIQPKATTTQEYATSTAQTSGALINILPNGEYRVVGSATLTEDGQVIRTAAHTILTEGYLTVGNLYFAPGAQGPFNMTDNKPKVLIPIDLNDYGIDEFSGKRKNYDDIDVRDYDNISLMLKQNAQGYKGLNIKPVALKSMTAYQLDDYLEQENTWVEMASYGEDGVQRFASTKTKDGKVSTFKIYNKFDNFVFQNNENILIHNFPTANSHSGAGLIAYRADKNGKIIESFLVGNHLQYEYAVGVNSNQDAFDANKNFNIAATINEDAYEKTLKLSILAKVTRGELPESALSDLF